MKTTNSSPRLGSYRGRLYDFSSNCFLAPILIYDKGGKDLQALGSLEAIDSAQGFIIAGMERVLADEKYHEDDRVSREQFMEVLDLAKSDVWRNNLQLVAQVYLKCQELLGKEIEHLPNLIAELTGYDEIRRNIRAIVYDEIDGDYVFLLLQSAKGYWQNPQGGIDGEESEIEAAIREIFEETSLDNVVVLEDTRYTTEYDANRNGDPIHVLLVAYAVKADSRKEIILSTEDGHLDSKWVSYDKALEMLDEYPEQIDVFTNIVNKLSL